MPHPSRRTFLTSSASTILASLPLGAALPSEQEEPTAPCAADAIKKRQNVILFMPDELRADALGCYGNPVCKTPAFDAIADAGTRFGECHTSYPICGASRCALLTGWPSHVRGHRSQQYFLRPEEPNLFRYLRQAGYDVYWFGKNDALSAQVFDESVTEWNSLDGIPISGGIGGHNAEQRQPGELTFLRDDPSPLDRTQTFDYHCVQAAKKILQRRECDRPFCIFLALNAPHPPYNAPAGFADMYSAADVGSPTPRDLQRRPDYMAGIRRAYGLDSISDHELRKVRAAYYGKVSYSDWLLGEVLESLDKTGHRRDTALIATSDHGDYAGDFGLVEKWPSGLEDCLTHVPLLAMIPGGPSNHVVTAQTQVYDVMQTCLDLAGTKATHTHFSRSLLPALHGDNGDIHRASFFEGGYNVYEPQCFEAKPAQDSIYYPRIYLQQSQPELVSRASGVKCAEYRYVSRPQGQDELYLLKDDPLELNNRFGDKSVAAVQEAAKTRLMEWYVNTSGIAPWDYDQRTFPPYNSRPVLGKNPGMTAILDEHNTNPR